ncbi:MAG TPA: DNA polymerase III subunit alpha, partial [Buchnera sp. (in: enterobacteria)]|nr:DNA polymerase III subunit alpha [Buchnera sp. (in: enterobacteria)]
GNITLANKHLLFYKKYFFNFFYLEIMRTGRVNEENYLHVVMDFAAKNNIPVVATNEVCFLHKEDFEAHKIRVAINTSNRLDDMKFIHNYSNKQFMLDEDMMCNLFHDIPESLVNSVEIAKRCNVFLELGKSFLPNFPTGNITMEDFLIKKSKEGIEKRLNILFPDKEYRNTIRNSYHSRLKNELNVINKMGFPSYFLIVMEFINWSKENNIPVGPGRGSGAGSLVAYALNITEINPLFFDLLFERFLNPDRISLPDFDIDFCMEKRDQVIKHVSEMYGKDSVSQIITFGTLTAKAVIRDVGRVLGYPYGFVNKISKLVPLDIGITLKKALSNKSELLELYNNNEEVKKIIDIAKKLEGVTRNVSKHAGGVVIASTKITDFAPLYYDSQGMHPVTQFDKNDVENVGLVKFDFLGLRTLTIMNWALKMINARRKQNNKYKIDLSVIPLNDLQAFSMLQKLETTGVFQLESTGMKDLIKRLKPDVFEDIIALVALFRPGPLQSGMVDNFINRKHGKESIFYPDVQWQHPLLKPVLESTYGIILYQEQVMEIARVLASYSLGHADILRRAMGKKDPIEMAKQRDIFKNRAKNNGINEQLSLKIFSLVEKFAGYGFNKSHSVAYALLSYQTLWLKAHYTAEFMAATMTADMHNIDKIIILVNTCRRLHVKIIPPNINVSKYYFYVNDKRHIIYGLGAIKGIGENSIKNIIENRKKNGIFKDLFDFCIRTDPKKITRCIIEKLIYSGALDYFGLNRGALIHIVSDTIKSANQYLHAQLIKQQDLFGSLLIDLEELKNYDSSKLPMWSDTTKLHYEYDSLGMYLTGHPIDQYLSEIKFYIKGNFLNKLNYSMNQNKKIIIAGIVTKFKIKFTKNRNKIAFFILNDSFGFLEVIVFNDTLKTYEHLLKNNNIIIIHGILNIDNFRNTYKCIAYKCINLCHLREKHVSKILILLHKQQKNSIFLNLLKKCLQSSTKGSTLVLFFYKTYECNINLSFSINQHVLLSNKLLDELRSLVGYNQIQLQFK